MLREILKIALRRRRVVKCVCSVLFNIPEAHAVLDKIACFYVWEMADKIKTGIK
jgi:hypothetical protein